MTPLSILCRRLILPALCLLQSLAQAAPPVEDPSQSFRVLCYHDIRDDLHASLATSPESTALDTRELVRHFSWLQKNGYHPVSLQHIVDARAGRATLPTKAVLLSFDDGYASTYTKVFPLLQQFNFPAMIAVVGSWIESPPSANKDAAQFVTWKQVREMQQSGLVEIASHSWDLHRGIPANPQGNLLPSATTLLFNSDRQIRESGTNHADRIRADLIRNADLIAQETGQRPRAMVWPYGAYSQPATDQSVAAGMPMAFTLEPGPNLPQQPLNSLRRSLVSFTTSVAELHDMLHEPAQDSTIADTTQRVVQVDLDYVYDTDPVVQERNLSTLIERIRRLHPGTVYLQAFADPDGDGVADALYFPNRHLPMRADLFSRVAWQLRTRAGVKVYAWMPVLAFRLPQGHAAATHLVRVDPAAPTAATHGRTLRLSPFDALARATIIDIYEDLGMSATFAGVLFHDDATLSDYEDSSPAALEVYSNEWQLPHTVSAIRANPLLRQRWTEHKTAYLNAFTLELADGLRRYQPGLMTARNLFAEPVLSPRAEEWYAQSLPSFLAIYDHVALMAMPQMEQAKDPVDWLKRLLQMTTRQPDALRKTVFELQSRDWRTGLPIPARDMAAQMRQLRLAGVRHLGYYPDDFHRNLPDETVIRPAFSLAVDPVPR
ncbi:poly-beta-1,6-N-acetyl-D-glucosamine N-deacetylase PgaB [Actimicrobium antarcticum]|uniref:Poly-beta-1,6-N-acetyl-D-glucosamine N-deacetylase PgaB n=1 Tax=Actimicrobium antarcticum TaxID=1051899 RepID=A0ABP7TAM7_9BURK